MKKLIFALALMLTTVSAFGSAAETFADIRKPVETKPPEGLPPLPKAEVIEVDVLDLVWGAVVYTNDWDKTKLGEVIPVTYDLGVRSNKAMVTIANVGSTNYSTTNFAYAPTEYCVQTVGSNGVRSVWSPPLLFPPAPITNEVAINLLNQPAGSGTWLTNTVLSIWTNPISVPPGKMVLWCLATNFITPTNKELNLMMSTNTGQWNRVQNLQKWTDTLPGSRWLLEFKSTRIK